MVNGQKKAKDITKYVMQYRECSRHVWNTYFLDIDLGSAFFDEVDRPLFDGLVLSELDEDIPYPNPVGYIPQIEVRYKVPPRGLRIMFNPHPEARTETWEERVLHSEDSHLCFIEFLDFVNDGDPRDLKYTRVRALNVAEAPDLNGADLLIETDFVRFLC